MDPRLRAFFRPTSIAVIGASPVRGKIGNVIYETLKSKFRGRLYPVNPKHSRVDGAECYPSVKDVPDEVDLAVVAVPAPEVVRVAEECGEKGVKGIVVISAGFSEVGGEGAERERRLVEVVRRYGMRLLGPNCLGVYDAFTGVDTWFLPEDRMARPPRGHIAVVSQSGALAAAILDWAAKAGVGIAKAVSVGNKADVDESDLMEYFAKDPDVEVIAIYLEGLRAGAGRRFVRTAREVVKSKPVVVLKAGKTERGRRAAASHTGSLAGSYEVYVAAFKRAGVIEAGSVLELFDMARALATQPLPKGRRVAVVTDGGGMGVMATDALESLGLELPRTPGEIEKRLKDKLPPFAALENPIDLTGSVEDEHYVAALEEVLRSGAFDMVMGIFLLQPPLLTDNLPEKVADVFSRYGEKPAVAVALGGSELTERLREALERVNVPVYEIPERAAKALWALAHYSEIRSKRASPGSREGTG